VSIRQGVAAFFDLDGTLLPPPSIEWRFISYLLWRDKLGTLNIARWLAHAARSFARGPRQAIEANKFYLAGLPVSLVADWADSIAVRGSNSEVQLRFFDEGLDRIAWHQSQNHRVFVVSGTLVPLATAVVNLLTGQVEVIATKLAVAADAHRDSHPIEVRATRRATTPSGKNSATWTGELGGTHMVGAAKGRALQEVAARHHLDLARSYAYGDSTADCAMLESVGYPEAVNPSRGLTHAARKRGWPVSRWKVIGEAGEEEPSLANVTGEI
jgi:HAD superfamily phosphoserine phosphatase-like hydrolase